jgi:hypothetical protein
VNTEEECQKSEKSRRGGKKKKRKRKMTRKNAEATPPHFQLNKSI